MSADTKVTAENFKSQIANCSKLLEDKNWDNFHNLYSKLDDFQKNSKSNADINNKWVDFYQKASKDLIGVLEQSPNFNTFVENLRHLSKVVADAPTLWKILNTNMNTELKVTLHECQLIAVEFFTPEQLFELGFDNFKETQSVDFSNITNEETLVDIFYALVGFERACNLPKTYVAKLPQYNDFIDKVLSNFITIPDFDSKRLVWLIEVIHEHTHIDEKKLHEICNKLVNRIVKDNVAEKNSLNKLYKICVLSSSPFLHTMKEIPTAIDDLFQKVLKDQRQFLRQYVICNFVSCDWLNKGPISLSDVFKCWRLYMINLTCRIQEKPELTSLLLEDAIEESLMMFEHYYGSAQPIQERSICLRMDIFAIIETIVILTNNNGKVNQKDKDKNANNQIPNQNAFQVTIDVRLTPTGLKRCWYLLYIAAVSGASEFDLKNAKPAAKDDSNDIMLGLDKYGADFLDYRIALEKLSKKFESEFSNFKNMVDFIRKNYKNTLAAMTSQSNPNEDHHEEEVKEKEKPKEKPKEKASTSKSKEKPKPKKK
ncbi:hypothetical protein M9Y10_013097 [Tritrichomonas musculus]|uniref:Uncharacterized protein n=1 Tax=Tritrichomonas musculus TaxID=1915356 RepID=A0ABR2I759_9EUKA